MKTNKLDTRASQDITIDELPKQDTPNNSDLLVVQSSSLTEATSIQQLRNKILAGGTSYGEDLGQMLFFTSKTQNPNMHAMDGTIGTKAEYPEFYNFLLTLETLERQFWALDEVNETFFFKNLGDKFIRATSNNGSVKTEGISNSYVVDHSHQVQGSYLDNFWVNPQTGAKPSTARKVLVERVVGDAIQKVGVPVKLGTDNSTISDKNAPSVFFYCYVVVRNLNRADSSLYIKSDGTISMNLDYTPTDINDVATKKYIDNKFLNYPIPLSFSINDIGKRVPYYKNADSNPTLIALDGTKYLIADYPDFDYETQEGFTNDGVYFWYNFLSLEMKTAIASISSVEDGFENNGYIRIGCFNNPTFFNSKLVYNFLQSSKGLPLLVVDGEGKDKDNFGFTILDATTYLIRMNVIFNANIKYFERVISGSLGQISPNPVGGLNFEETGSIFDAGVTQGEYLLKIQPDYMVAKIQQVGSVAGAGDLKADRSVNLTGVGVFNSKQVCSMDDLKDSNIIVGDSVRVITTLDSKLNQIDTNIDTINDNIGSVDITALQTQTNTNTADIATNLSLFNSYKNKINQFQENWTRGNIASTVINSSPTVLTNLTNIISGAGVVKVQTKRNNNGEALINNPTLIPITNGWKLPILDMKVYKLDIRVGITGSLSGTAGTSRELIVYLRRVSDNSIATNGGVIKINDNNFNGRGTTLFSYILTENDTFITNGFYIDLLNNSGANLTLTSLNIFIAGV